jgi:hypothetical protein
VWQREEASPIAAPIKVSWCTDPARDSPSAQELDRATGTPATPCTRRPGPVISGTVSTYRRTMRLDLCSPSLEGASVVGRSVSRRSLLAWCATVSLGGCAEDEAGKIARDPYLPTMMKDPLYTWRPGGDLTRTEILLPKSDDQLAGGTRVSRISVHFVYRTSGDASSLLQQAQRISSDAGYVNGYREDSTGLRIHSSMGTLSGENGILVILLAPA